MSFNAARRLPEMQGFAGGQLSTLNTSRSNAGLSFDNFWKAYSINIETSWQPPVRTKMTELMALEQNWDGYGAPAIRRETGMFALDVLEKIMQPGTPIPDIVPSSVGGIQIEWHEKGIDIEFHVAAPYECELWFQDRFGFNPSVSMELTDNIGAFWTAVSILTSR